MFITFLISLAYEVVLDEDFVIHVRKDNMNKLYEQLHTTADEFSVISTAGGINFAYVKKTVLVQYFSANDLSFPGNIQADEELRRV